MIKASVTCIATYLRLEIMQFDQRPSLEVEVDGESVDASTNSTHLSISQ